MIIGITGAICSGKGAFAEYLKEKYGFEIVDLLERFKVRLQKLGIKKYINHKELSPFKSKVSEEECIQQDDPCPENIPITKSNSSDQTRTSTEDELEGS